MRRHFWLALLFAVAFAVVFLGPPFLSRQFGGNPLMKTEDVIGVLVPIVMIPIYWALLRASMTAPPSAREMVTFLVFAALWAEGQGMHLAANSISHLLGSAKGTDPYRLTYFYDEILGHYLWHIGVIGLSVLLMVQSWRNGLAAGTAEWRWMLLPGLVYGLAFFMIVIEGQTAPMGVPFSALAGVAALLWARGRLAQRPVAAFFVAGYFIAALLFAGWAAYWGWLPQFSDVGIIE